MISRISICRRSSLKFAVLATSLGALVATSAVAALLGLWGQRGLFLQMQQLLLHNDRAVVERLLREGQDNLAERAESLTKYSELVQALAQRKAEAIEEYAVPVFNRLSKQGIKRFRFFTGEGQLIFEAHDGGTGSTAGRLVKEALAQRQRVSGLALDQGEPLLVAALPLYAKGELSGVLELGAGLDGIVHATGKILGSQVGLFAPGGDGMSLHGATDAALLTAAAGRLWLKDKMSQAQRQIHHLQGTAYALSVIPLEAEPGHQVGIILSAADATVLDQAMKRTMVLVGITTLGGILVALLITFLSLSRRLQPIGALTRALDQVAQGEGDLTRRLQVRSADEIGRLANSFNAFLDKLQTMIGEIRQTSVSIDATAQQLSAAAGQLSNGAQAQASSLEETAASLEQMSGTVRKSADRGHQMSQLALGARDAAEKGQQVVTSAMMSMQEITKASQKMAEIVTAIDDIAFQTNLLALNAAVEAARAGVQGRSFAVVAAEVRNLAQRSAAAAREIKALIQDSVQKVQDGSELVDRSGQTLEEIVAAVQRVTVIIAEIATTSQEQSQGIDQVSKAVTQMDHVVQQSTGQTEELSSTAQLLAGQAQQLQALVWRFRLSDRMAPQGLVGTTSASPAIARPLLTAVAPQAVVRKAAAVAAGGIAGEDAMSSTGDGFEEF
jgi:methyl-accepting chemotaxis protein